MATMSTMAIQVNKLTCPVCCDRFKTPKMLQCGHSFCQPCVYQLFQSTPVSCPVCRVQVSTTDISVDQLPTNYVLKALVDSDTYPIDEEFLCRSLGECSTHEDVCDQFCITCEEQVCKQCIIDHHQGSPHDTSPVGAVVAQQTESLGNLAVELSDLMKRLKSIGSKITDSQKTCQLEADQLGKDINASVAECTENMVGHAESLQIVVEEDKVKILQYLDDLKLQHSEIFLSASYALDLCQSLLIDLDKNNLSRVAVMKRLIENRKKIKKDLEKLEGKKNVLHIGLKFQPLTSEAKAGKLESKTSAIPVAIPMKTISFSNELNNAAGLLVCLWPTPTWMITVSQQTEGYHTFVRFTNLHFLRETFRHEIGVDQKWSHVSHSDNDGKFILCVSSGRVHKFSLASKQNLQEPGKIVSTVFTPKAILGIAWDKVQFGCYTLLNDGKTLLHVEFGGPQGFKEIAVLDEEVTSCEDTHFFHVNEEGSMAICDHEKKIVLFFEKIDAEPTLTVRAPPNVKDPSPVCINTRRGEKLWYVLWKSQPSSGAYVVKLYVYDSSFQLIGSVQDLCLNLRSEKSRVMFCFQRDYVAVTIDDKVEVYNL